MRRYRRGGALAKEKKIDLMIAVGGGSVIDCCKIVSAQAKLEEDIWEMEFSGHKYPSDFIPMIAVVTASGTGAEQNNGAVITHEEKRSKQACLAHMQMRRFLIRHIRCHCRLCRQCPALLIH